jgi:uncharacterized protein
MLARGFGSVATAFAALTLCACNDAANESSKTDQSSAERISAGLDVCAPGREGFAQRVCQNRVLASLDNQVRETLVAESAAVSDAGAALLVQNQTRWREAQRVECGVLEPDAEPTTQQQACLESEFRARAG